MKLFYVSTDSGCGIRKSKDLDHAIREARREVGTLHFKGVREATEKDVKWVRSMGGRIPGDKSL